MDSFDRGALDEQGKWRFTRPRSARSHPHNSQCKIEEVSSFHRGHQGRLALTPALSPEARVRGGIVRTLRSNVRVCQRLERGETDPVGEGRVRVPSP